jgi:cell wall-associated NlpC family hydrolase
MGDTERPRFALSPGGHASGAGRWLKTSAIAIGVIMLAIAFAIVRGPGTDSGNGKGGSNGTGSTAATGVGGAVASDTAVGRTPARCAAETCWVAVNVATLWVKPWYPRPVDRPALANPADPGRWVRAMTVAQKSWLVGRLESQVLYGTKVTVIGHYGSGWTKVAVPGQPTNRDRRGYPGWVPTRQLTRSAPASAATSAAIRSPTAWLWSSWTSRGVTGTKVMQVSYDTRLSVVRATSAYVEVTLIGGRRAALRRADVALHAAGTSWGATRARVVAEARKFLGLQYLWAGTSGFGFDCSGFTYAVDHVFGVTLSRDADQQAVHGRAVPRSSLRPGDLVFFRGSQGGPVTHVGMYVGGGKMIDAPHTGAGVRIESVWSFGIYAGARRYLSQ